ncbi:YjhX family toxin [Brevundimonas sp.]|uniref:YjhX family toxin n=1 Tax=Brevundimonas sp. TaxID=1871086 RepID=UPI0025B9B79D|nr:YjhX family toxin [Brevundimonas sp.]
MNISRAEQRTLHALAQGGRILLERDDQGRIIAARCFTREGWVLESCDLSQWRSLKRKRVIISRSGGPYVVNRDGLSRLRSQLDNRTSGRGF